MTVIASDVVFDALVDAGVLDDHRLIRRVVIDLVAGEVAVLHVERFADQQLLDVVPATRGVEIRTGTPT